MCLNLLKEKWDVAIILDACRYDTFKKYYKNFFPDGKLERRLGASHTGEWLIQNFKNYSPDVVYVSGHPAINKIYNPLFTWIAQDKFFEIFEAWKICWDNKINTTHPRCLKKIAFDAIRQYPNKRILIHFTQPHTPYKDMPSKKLGEPNLGLQQNVDFIPNTLITKARKNLRRILYEYHTIGLIYAKIVKKLKKIRSLEREYLRRLGLNKTKELYEKNLIWALKEVGDLVKKIKKEFPRKIIVVTSDHGEAFGEFGDFFHEYTTNNPIVRIVPFLIIE